MKRIVRGEYDLVVFGSIMRNLRIFTELRHVLDPMRTVLINGEDLMPSEATFDYLRATGCHTFVRSID